MNDRQSDELDWLLKSWAERQEPSPQQLAELADRISRAAASSSEKTARLQNDVSAGRARRLKLAIAAAVLVIACLSAWVSRPDKQADPHRVVEAAVPIRVITTQERKQKQKLLAELDRMFDGKQVWFAETDTDVVVGSDESPPNVSVAQRTLAMRLVLAKRRQTSDSWQPVWSADVVSRTDQLVRFVFREPNQPSADFTGWAHVMPDGLIACDVDFRWNDGLAGTLTNSLILSPGDIQAGDPTTVSGVEYRLFHVASLLEKS